VGVKDRAGKNGDSPRGARAPTRARYNSDSEFVALELDKEQTAAYRSWRLDLEAVEEVWSAVLEEGYRVNTKYDDYSGGYAAFVIPADGSDNSGFLLAGRGGTPYRAVCEALFKHEFVLKRAWGSFVPQRDFRNDPDF